MEVDLLKFKVCSKKNIVQEIQIDGANIERLNLNLQKDNFNVYVLWESSEFSECLIKRKSVITSHTVHLTSLLFFFAFGIQLRNSTKITGHNKPPPTQTKLITTVSEIKKNRRRILKKQS